MRIGIMSGHGRQDEGIDALIAKARDLETRGFDTMWVANIFAIDAITAGALIGRETSRFRARSARFRESQSNLKASSSRTALAKKF